MTTTFTALLTLSMNLFCLDIKKTIFRKCNNELMNMTCKVIIIKIRKKNIPNSYLTEVINANNLVIHILQFTLKSCKKSLG